MGTHPIFESDFDCLTESQIINSAMFEDIMKNMEKELQGQFNKVKQIDNERQMVAKRVGQLEAQVAECKVVMMELDVAEEDSKCFKVLGPVLVDQSLSEAKETVTKRQEVMNTEAERMKKGVHELTERFKKEQQLLNELNVKAKQIKDALATA